MVEQDKLQQEVLSYLNAGAGSQEPASLPAEQQSPNTDRGFFDSIGQGVSAGVERLRGGLASSLQVAAKDSDKVYSRYQERRAENSLKRSQELEEDLDTVGQIASMGTQMAPTIGSMFIPGTAALRMGATLGTSVAQNQGQILQEQRALGQELDADKANAAALASGAVDATIGRFLPVKAAPIAKVATEAGAGAASGAQGQIFHNLATGQAWDSNLGTATVAGGVLGGGLSGMNQALNIARNPGGDNALANVSKMRGIKGDNLNANRMSDYVEYNNKAYHDMEQLANTAGGDPRAIDDLVEQKVNTDKMYGAPAAYMDALMYLRDKGVPVNAAGMNFQMTNWDRTQNLGNFGEDVMGYSNKEMQLAGKAARKATGSIFRTKKAKEAGETKSSYDKEISQKGNGAIADAIGSLQDNITIVGDLRSKFRKEGAPQNLMAKLSELEKDLADIKHNTIAYTSNSGDNTAGSIEIISRRALKNAMDLGVYDQLKGFNREAGHWNPMQDYKTVEAMHDILKTQMPSYRQGTPDPYAENNKRLFSNADLGIGIMGGPGVYAAKKGAEVAINSVLSLKSQKNLRRTKAQTGSDIDALRTKTRDLSKTPTMANFKKQAEANAAVAAAGSKASETAMSDELKNGNMHGAASSAESALESSGIQTKTVNDPTQTPIVGDEVVTTTGSIIPDTLEVTPTPTPRKKSETSLAGATSKPEIKIEEVSTPTTSPKDVRTEVKPSAKAPKKRVKREKPVQKAEEQKVEPEVVVEAPQKQSKRTSNKLDAKAPRAPKKVVESRTEPVVEAKPEPVVEAKPEPKQVRSGQKLETAAPVKPSKEEPIVEEVVKPLPKDVRTDVKPSVKEPKKPVKVAEEKAEVAEKTPEPVVEEKAPIRSGEKLSVEAPSKPVKEEPVVIEEPVVTKPTPKDVRSEVKPTAKAPEKPSKVEEVAVVKEEPVVETKQEPEVVVEAPVEQPKKTSPRSGEKLLAGKPKPSEAPSEAPVEVEVGASKPRQKLIPVVDRIQKEIKDLGKIPLVSRNTDMSLRLAKLRDLHEMYNQVHTETGKDFDLLEKAWNDIKDRDFVEEGVNKKTALKRRVKEIEIEKAERQRKLEEEARESIAKSNDKHADQIQRIKDQYEKRIARISGPVKSAEVKLREDWNDVNSYAKKYDLSTEELDTVLERMGLLQGDRISVPTVRKNILKYVEDKLKANTDSVVAESLPAPAKPNGRYDIKDAKDILAKQALKAGLTDKESSPTINKALQFERGEISAAQMRSVMSKLDKVAEGKVNRLEKALKEFKARKELEQEQLDSWFRKARVDNPANEAMYVQQIANTKRALKLSEKLYNDTEASLSKTQNYLKQQQKGIQKTAEALEASRARGEVLEKEIAREKEFERQAKVAEDYLKKEGADKQFIDDFLEIDFGSRTKPFEKDNMVLKLARDKFRTKKAALEKERAEMARKVEEVNNQQAEDMKKAVEKMDNDQVVAMLEGFQNSMSQVGGDTDSLKAYVKTLDAVVKKAEKVKELKQENLVKTMKTMEDVLAISADAKSKYPDNPEVWFTDEQRDAIQKAVGSNTTNVFYGTAYKHARAAIFGTDAQPRQILSGKERDKVMREIDAGTYDGRYSKTMKPVSDDGVELEFTGIKETRK